jgi:NAD(P)-dependent dehydrogenase (short-subunit alcohol dehydrogenase family)
MLAGAPAGADAGRSLGGAVREACTGLGARICECELSGEVPGGEVPSGQEGDAIEQAVGGALADGASIELLVVDSASVFARAIQRDGRSRDALRNCLDSSWNATRMVANAAFMPDAHGGRIVYLAPPADAGEHADAARAGLENLARTLSIEWARHGVTLVAIVPGARSGGADAAGEVAALTAYLASPAGAYFSGCLLDLRGPSRGRPGDQ